ncbi:hypothetical protein V2W55_20225, partial [Acinetobacter baumannii]|uniref:hypothetical protein n=1 Tax=Acinetobacter baumannii TaxID=470 RepID=UPI00312C9C68
VLDPAFAGGIEDFFLDLGVDRQFETDLLRDLLLESVPARLFEVGEQILDGSMVLLEQGDRVHLCGFGHWATLLFRLPPQSST